MTGHEPEWGLRFPDGEVSEGYRTRAEAWQFIANMEPEDGPAEVVVRLRTPWTPESITGKLSGTLPATECSNCKGTKLGFEVSATGNPSRVEFYQGCDDCSETLWVGDWDLFHAVLGLLYDIRIPRCE